MQPIVLSDRPFHLSQSMCRLFDQCCLQERLFKHGPGQKVSLPISLLLFLYFSLINLMRRKMTSKRRFTIPTSPKCVSSHPTHRYWKMRASNSRRMLYSALELSSLSCLFRSMFNVLAFKPIASQIFVRYLVVGANRYLDTEIYGRCQ